MYVYCMSIMRETLPVRVQCATILALTRGQQLLYRMMLLPLSPRLQCRTKSIRIPRVRTL